MQQLKEYGAIVAIFALIVVISTVMVGLPLLVGFIAYPIVFGWLYPSTEARQIFLYEVNREIAPILSAATYLLAIPIYFASTALKKKSSDVGGSKAPKIFRK